MTHYRQGHYRNTKHGQVWVNGHDVANGPGNGGHGGYGHIIEHELDVEKQVVPVVVPEWKAQGFTSQTHFTNANILTDNEANFGYFYDNTPKNQLSEAVIINRNNGIIKAFDEKQSKLAEEKKIKEEIREMHAYTTSAKKQTYAASSRCSDNSSKAWIWILIIIAVIVVIANPELILYAVGAGLVIAALPFALTVAAGFLAWYGGIAILMILAVAILG
ncbi:hypothetical protein [Vibrio crassostreae]|uniref:hypothetical protein n=1 Tax=Vibrio crassostreae TaxID=246167 RepID=UPI0002F4265D|nr:hypothetical protein [Vibrio crassostreae]OED86999.1 hypothetical protein A141_17055 [Vibrio crassostreae ZF-91]